MRKAEVQAVPAHETLWTGMGLAVVGGFLDAYTYLLRGGVFANAQTGNLVLLSVNAASGNFLKAGYYLVPIFAFALGVLVTEWLRKQIPEKSKWKWTQIVLLLEALLLFLIGFLPYNVSNAIVNISISFLCSMQVNSFRKLNGMAYATTMCTGNLRSAAECLYRYVTLKDCHAGKHAVQYIAIILFFCLGAALGAVSSQFFWERSIWICSFILLAILLSHRRPPRPSEKPVG